MEFFSSVHPCVRPEKNGWWWGEEEEEEVVVVVVLTVCLDDVSMHATKRRAPNYGGRVPCGHDPRPLYLCTGP